MLGPQRPNRLDSAHARKSQVHQHDIYRLSRADIARIFSRSCLTDHHHVGLQSNYCCQPKANDRMIVYKENPYLARVRHVSGRWLVVPIFQL
jgi:hypothetical protein